MLDDQPNAQAAPPPLDLDHTRRLMRRAALGALLGVAVGTAVVAACVLAARLMQGPAAEIVPTDADPTQAALRSRVGVLVLTGMLGGMLAAGLTTWLALAPLGSWFRRGGLALVAGFGTVLAMLALIPIDQAAGVAGLGSALAVLLLIAAGLGLLLARQRLAAA